MVERKLLWGGASLLIAAPVGAALARLPGFDWNAGDFALFGAMVLILCLAGELALRAAPNRTYLLAAAIAAVAGFLLAWANLAVGVIGAPGNPANLGVWLVLGGGAIGAGLVRLAPRGLALVLRLMAAAQWLMAGAALLTGEPVVTIAGILFFSPLWGLAAHLFERSASQPVQRIA